MIQLSHRYQRTIAQAVEVCGVGFLSGNSVSLRFQPAPIDTGIVFYRTDVQPAAAIPAHIDFVSGTHRRTTLGEPPHHVSLVEHVLAALGGLRIDNCRVEVNAPEPPGLDGSSGGFVAALKQAGLHQQAARRPVISVGVPVYESSDSATLTLHPGAPDELKISYFLDYGHDSPIMPQVHTQVITPEAFSNELADARTFLLECEARELQKQGLGSGITTTDLLVFDDHGPMDNQLRHADELARHKILDIIGDLSLLGCDLRGHIVAHRSGHPLNVSLARTLAHHMSGKTTHATPAAA